MNYGYVRVSSITQNIDRQMDEMYRNGLVKKQIFVDKQSGKDFERTNYKRLIKKLRKKDLLIIKSIDRLGRDYKMIIEEWNLITKIIEADILVLDTPLLDTRTDATNLIGVFISDIVLQILSFVAETERDNIRQRQAEGIRLARERGVHLGRPKYILPNNFRDISSRYINKKIDMIEALEVLNMKKSTFLKYSSIQKIIDSP